MPKVTGFRVHIDSIEKDIKDSFERLGWRDHIKRDSKVFVKPNFTLPFFKPGVTTHEFLLEASLNVLKDRASEVYVGESDGGYGSFCGDDSLRGHNVADMCRRTGASMVNLSKVESARLVDRIGRKRIEVTVPRLLMAMDVSVSIPVLKVHTMTKVSLSLKNLWGCNPDALRLLDHKNLSWRLAMIAKAIHLKYAIVDAIVGLNEYGPMEGKAVDINAVLVGDNPVASDATAARLMGFDPSKIEHIVNASKFGLGPYEEDQIDVISDLSAFQQRFCLRRASSDLFSDLTFRSNLISKIVFDSPFTKTAYFLVRKKQGRKILKPGDEA